MDNTDTVAENTIALKTRFSIMVKQEALRTNFKRERIGFYLPHDLQDIFKNAGRAGGGLADNELGQRLFKFVEEEIYGALPAFNAFATPEQANGIFIGGKVVSALTMSRQAAFRQLSSLIKGEDTNSFIKTLSDKLYPKYGLSDIKGAMYGSGGTVIDRQMVAHILIESNAILENTP